MALLAVCVFGGWGIAKLRAWFRDDDDATVTDREMLHQIRKLHGQGELTDTEYRSIKNQISERIRQHETLKQSADNPANGSAPADDERKASQPKSA